jgi:RIP homotypic interaction motif
MKMMRRVARGWLRERGPGRARIAAAVAGLVSTAALVSTPALASGGWAAGATAGTRTGAQPTVQVASSNGVQVGYGNQNPQTT